MTTDPQPRRILPDAFGESRVILIKAASYLRLTREIRTCTYVAKKRKLEFVLVVPSQAKLSDELNDHILQYSVVLRRDDQP